MEQIDYVIPTSMICRIHVCIFGQLDKVDSIDKRRWKCINTKGEIPSRRDCHSAVIYDSRMYIFGGGWLKSNIFVTQI